MRTILTKKHVQSACGWIEPKNLRSDRGADINGQISCGHKCPKMAVLDRNSDKCCLSSIPVRTSTMASFQKSLPFSNWHRSVHSPSKTKTLASRSPSQPFPLLTFTYSNFLFFLLYTNNLKKKRDCTGEGFDDQPEINLPDGELLVEEQDDVQLLESLRGRKWYASILSSFFQRI